jgi:cytochrome c oxidase subunit 1/cytochrome c oxidase subunit I+III
LPIISKRWDREKTVEEERIARITTDGGNDALARRLTEIWERPHTLHGWLASVDHKDIGRRYLVTAFLLLAIGGIEALILRLQLAGPEEKLLGPEAYNQMFTMHGITMIFLYAQPILSGFANFLWPLVLGARDMAFPRLNALSYWIFLFAALFFYASFALGVAPDDGWFNYVPYASRDFDPGPNIDFFSLGMIFLGVSTTVGSVNFVVTWMRHRAPGMSLNRLPIIVWGTLTASAANIIVIPAVSLAFFLLWLDRQFGTDFFTVGAGGEPLLWQHLFWMFAHPWVYVLVLPAIGLSADAIPPLCRHPLVGYTPVALATVSTMAIGFGVWVHHMFATGLPGMSLAFFSGASIVIAIPSAVTVFALTATIAAGRPVLNTAFLFFSSFIILFVIGGVSGFMTGSVPVDWQLTDTYFVVAHIHYVLIGMNVFPVVGSLYFWFPKMTGRMLGERLGKWNFWLMFVGTNIAFLPMHLTGLWGMPRRIYTYPPGMGWSALNMVTTVGAFILAVGVLLLIVNVLVSLKKGALAPANPWQAGTLEWAMPSPAPAYNFVVIPTVASRHPLWEDQLRESEGRSHVYRGYELSEAHETIGSTTVDAIPEIILRMPGESLAPLFLAICMAAVFTALLLHFWWGVGAAGLGILAALLVWFWPERHLGQAAPRDGVAAAGGAE